MTSPSSFTYRNLLFITFAACAVFTPACGDDEGAIPAPAVDAGGDTSSPTSEDTSESTSPAAVSSSSATSSSDTDVGSCALIATDCAGKDDEDGVGALCLDIAGSSNAAECDAVVDTCQAFCKDGTSPSADAGAPSAEQCDVMGESCHEYDEGGGLGHLCHEVGHGGNLTWCAVIYEACASLCHITEGDAGHAHEQDAGHAHDAGSELSHEAGEHHASDAATTNPAMSSESSDAATAEDASAPDAAQ